MLEHGGNIQAYARQYNIPVSSWLDLSTGINPNGWPVPDVIPASLWSKLPETEDDLVETAKRYYQCEHILSVAGSQAAIQLLPFLRAASRVAILTPAYREHWYCWNRAGHEVTSLNSDDLDQQIEQFDVVIVVNPNNPTGEIFSTDQLLNWHRRLQQRSGWLIVDEAFIDNTPQLSLAHLPSREGLIILRSLGKFFGLAGLRVGFVIGPPDLLRQLAEAAGPWPVASISRWIASQALADQEWQLQSRQLQYQKAQRLNDLLTHFQLPTTGGCALFQWVTTDHASNIHDELARKGILCRLFDKPSSLRFGLPAQEEDWLRLERALEHLISL